MPFPCECRPSLDPWMDCEEPNRSKHESHMFEQLVLQKNREAEGQALADQVLHGGSGSSGSGSGGSEQGDLPGSHHACSTTTQGHGSVRHSQSCRPHSAKNQHASEIAATRSAERQSHPPNKHTFIRHRMASATRANCETHHFCSVGVS